MDAYPAKRIGQEWSSSKMKDKFRHKRTKGEAIYDQVCQIKDELDGKLNATYDTKAFR